MLLHLATSLYTNQVDKVTTPTALTPLINTTHRVNYYYN